MSKLSELIDKRIDSKLDSSVLKYAPAVVLAVGDEYKRVDVKLLANGAVIKGILNKTKEELSIGDSVRVAYFTLPSSGWIDFVNGEARPIGGGAGIEVASAAILTDTTAADFIIDREVMIDYSPSTKVLYGSSPSFIILNGNYAYFSNILLRDDSAGKNNVIAHSEYFGGGITLRGVAYDPALTDNEYNVVDITITTRIESMQYNSTNTTSPYMEDAGIYASGQYGDTPVSKINRFVLMQNMAYRQNGWVEDIMLVPRIGTIFQPTDENIKALLPEGVTFVMEVVLETLWKIGNTWSQNNSPPRISPYSIGWSNNNNSKFYAFFKDQAEQDFALGVTQRSEPVEVTS